ncbi:MAG: N-acetylglutaminylglutamine amidotransferase [Alphaproteobacteria bacterium]|jgi:asparagine synthase (glutamine-hydrolysing)|nr:N-acetylglutaminylglutamine amidotransferase [Alphaproteobacteria bacterium]
MCGLSGEIRFDGRPADPAALAAMTDTLAPRGPDGTGLFLRDRVGLGHRRLKIIDLSDRAAQPMVDSDLGLTLVFNGIIYNYQELRAELQRAGHRFFSGGDTEVVLKAYHTWGEACVERFHGMFAFAIWERDSGRLFLARDRLGIKPLYYAETNKALRFASSLPALVAAGKTDGGLDTDLDPVALAHYMTFHAVVPPPHTILNGVKKLKPATTLMIEPDGRKRERNYWQPVFARDPADAGLSAEAWQERVLAALTKAVQRRLVADVPVGVLLSGGLDSSLVVGLLAALGQTGLKTFSIGFETVGNERGDEFDYSDIVARHFGTDHRKIFIPGDRALPALEPCVKAMAEPMVSHDAIGFYLLSQEVSQHVKVVQSGQGADEIFAGYHWYPPMMESRDPVADYARVFCDRDQAELHRAIDPRLHLAEDVPRDFIAGHFAMPGAEVPIDKALRIDTHIMLVDDPVKRVDNMTMAWGLEARVPFLDHELVELAAKVPPELKVGGGGKGVLKEAARRVIPNEVIDRPKGYFPVPALKYLEGDYLGLVKDVLSARRARERGLFQQDYLDTLLAAPDEHITPLRGSKLWQCALLEYWLQLHDL